jgi:hypothetical protein
MLSFLNVWGRELRDSITVIPIETFIHQRTVLPGTYIISDIERLTPAMAATLGRIWNSLSSQGGGFRLLNHPTASMRRFQLLAELHRRGINCFKVYRVSDDPSPERYPVFIRGMNDHRGSLTSLLYTPIEFHSAINNPKMRRTKYGETMAVEYCDTSDQEGIFRKYAAFRVGGRIIPRHVFFKREWMIKEPGFAEADMLEEERRFLEKNPHEQALMEIFELARIDYGRIDYGLLDGAVQVWEINSNPMIASAISSSSPARLEAHKRFVTNMVEALRALDSGEHLGAPMSMPEEASEAGPLAGLLANLKAKYYYLKYRNRK